MLKRKIYDELLSWKNKNSGQIALLINGARRSCRQELYRGIVCKAGYKSHIIIDFGFAPQDILDLFINESTDLDLFFAKLSIFFSTVFHKREFLIVFDEVRQFPRARQLIKYLVVQMLRRNGHKLYF